MPPPGRGCGQLGFAPVCCSTLLELARVSRNESVMVRQLVANDSSYLIDLAR